MSTEPTNDTPPADDTAGTDEHPAVADARKYRSRAQTAEAERDALAAQLDTLRRGEIERRVGDRLARPGDLWLVVDDPGAFYTDGTVNEAALGAAVDGILEDRPHWGRTLIPPPSQRPVADLAGGTDPTTPPTPPGWLDVVS